MSRKVLGFGDHGKEKEEKSRFIEDMSLLLQKKSLEERLQASTRVVEEKRVN